MIKCIIWDLDDTIWDGKVVENSIKIKSNIISFIKETNERGIINSISSKNDFGQAIKILEEHNIKELFVYPQINFQNKSLNIKKILEFLNVFPKDVYFVDNEDFELAEVKRFFPDINVVNSDNIEFLKKIIINQKDFDPFRVQKYKSEEVRVNKFIDYNGDIKRFYIDCEMKMHISQINQLNIEAAFRLINRSNRYNFGINTKEINEKLTKYTQLENQRIYILNASDKYGDYGVCGVCVVNIENTPVIELFSISCRLKGKGFAESFFAFVLNDLKSMKKKYVLCRYTKTDFNKNMRIFLLLFKFIPLEKNNECQIFKRDLNEYFEYKSWIKLVDDI